MQKYLQARNKNIIIKCILGIIILSLIFGTIFSAIHSYINYNSEKYIAIVNGEKISFNTFQKMYALEREQQKKTLGKNFFKICNDPRFIKQTYDYIISQLVNNVLLEQYTNKIKLQLSDTKIKKIIFNSPLFQRNKKFNEEKYFNYLAAINLTNHEYINKIKNRINTEHLIKTITNSNFILNNEKNHIIKLLSEKRQIRKSIIKIDSIINKQRINNSEVKQYFYNHKNNFYIPEKFKISFVKLNVDKFKTHFNNQEIYDSYSKNIKKYLTEGKKRYSIIQTKKKEEALLIISKLSHAPEDFSKIAKEHSIDPISSKNGGDIGWISENITPHEIKNAHLNKKNQISDAIPFRNTFLIIKLNDTILPQPKKINEVSNIIKKKLQHEKSLNLYNTFVKKISDIVKNNPKNIALTLKKNNISIEHTDWFSENSIPKNLNNFILKKIIFDKKILQNHQKIKSYFHFIILNKHESFLIKLDNFQNKKMPLFKNIKNNIIYKLKIIKAIKENQKKAVKIINELQKGKNSLFKKFNLHFTNSEIISRYDNNPMKSMIFSLPHPKNGEKKYILYQDQNKNFIIIALEHVYNTKFSLEEDKMITKYAETNNTQIIFNSILKNLREKSIIIYKKIEDNKKI